jgi:drug/metabolite transporter (DMT)-like permease
MKRTAWLSFIVFCVLSSGAWLIPAPTEPDAAFEQHGLLYLITALILCALQPHPRWLMDHWQRWLRISISGIALFGLPAILAQLTAGSISPYTVSAIFALLPIPAILVLTQQDSNADQTRDVRRFFAPALIVITGLLLLIPTDLPHSTRGLYLLPLTCACLIVVAIASVRIYDPLQKTTLPQALSIILFTNGCFLLAAAAITGHLSPDNLHPAALISLSNTLYLAVNILLIVLFRNLAPLLLSTRYLLIPLLTILQGIVLLRPHFTLQMGCGLLLMIGGLAWFFATARAEETRSNSLRPR